MIKNVVAAVVDKFDYAQSREPQSHAIAGCLVDLLGAGNTFFDHARRFIHDQGLQAWNYVAGRRPTNHRYLADRFKQGLQCIDDGRRGSRVFAEFHQRDHVGRIQPVRIDQGVADA